MVGVPGRSKSCNTCRQRKIACSLEKPECRICIKSGRACTGYQRGTIFLLDHRSKGDGPRTYQKPGSAGQIPTLAPQKIGTTASSRRDGPSGSLVIHPHSKSIARTISPSARPVYRQQILNEFLSLSIPSAHLITQHEATREAASSWLTLLPTLPDLTAALETSILALCTATIGRANKNQALVHESLKFYTQGLWELQKALWNPNLMYRDATLATCMLLIAYEVTECPDQALTGWLNHMKGCSKLFELRGPKAYDSGFGHQLFSSFRLLEIQQAITDRRHTYLSNLQWIDLPWKTHKKTQYHKLLDTMTSLPDVIADGYEVFAVLQGAAETQTLDVEALLVRILEIIDRCWKLDARFRAFYADLERENLGPLYWPELSAGMITTADETELGKIFPVSFQFLNIGMAHMCMLYWTSSAILWSGMAYMYKVIAGFQALQPLQEGSPSNNDATSPGFGMAHLPPLGHRIDVASVAKNICQSVEYSLQFDDQSPWKTRAVFPIKVAIETLHDAPGCERELDWSIAAMEKMTSGGVQILSHVGVKWTDHAFLPG